MYLFFFLNRQYQVGSYGTDKRFLLHIISPRTDQRIKYSLQCNISKKAFQIFITSFLLTIELPLSICMGFHELRASLCISTWVAALCTNDHVNDTNPIWRLWRCFICTALLRHRVFHLHLLGLSPLPKGEAQHNSAWSKKIWMNHSAVWGPSAFRESHSLIGFSTFRSNPPVMSAAPR